MAIEPTPEHGTAYFRAYQGTDGELVDLLRGEDGKLYFDKLMTFLQEQGQLLPGMEFIAHGGHNDFPFIHGSKPGGGEGYVAIGFDLRRSNKSGKTGLEGVGKLSSNYDDSVDRLALILQVGRPVDGEARGPSAGPNRHTFDFGYVGDESALLLYQDVIFTMGTREKGGVAGGSTVDNGLLGNRTGEFQRIFSDLREPMTSVDGIVWLQHYDGAFNIRNGQSFAVQATTADDYQWVYDHGRQAVVAIREHELWEPVKALAREARPVSAAFRAAMRRSRNGDPTAKDKEYEAKLGELAEALKADETVAKFFQHI